MSRLIIFGDIHGCIREWENLLRKLAVAPTDHLISVGDLVAKGPDTRAVLELARSLPNLRCVLGNHEAMLVDHWAGHKLDQLPRVDHRIAVAQLGKHCDDYLAWIAGWPLYLDLDECLVVHAGIRPGIPLAEQTRADLLNLRALQPGGAPWYNAYTGEKLIVHGHWAAQGLAVRERVIGLDSGCVYGGALSAVILPERQIVQVPACKAYVPLG